MLALFIIVAGAISITQLPIAQYPTIAPPSIIITATYPGASAKTLDDAVTSIIEQEMNGADGLLYIESVSQAGNGQATITVTFKPGTDPALAQVDVQNRLKRVEARLPSSVTQQGVQVDKTRSNFLLFATLISKDGKMDPVALGDYISRNVLNEVKRVPGVGQAVLFGTERAMRIWIDPAKLVGYKLTPTDVYNAIRNQNALVSAGTLGDLPSTSDQPIAATVVVEGQMTTTEQFGNIVLVSKPDGSQVRIKDVARLGWAARPTRLPRGSTASRSRPSACSSRRRATLWARPRRSRPSSTSSPSTSLPASSTRSRTTPPSSCRSRSRKWSRRCSRPWRWCSW